MNNYFEKDASDLQHGLIEYDYRLHRNQALKDILFLEPICSKDKKLFPGGLAVSSTTFWIDADWQMRQFSFLK